MENNYVSSANDLLAAESRISELGAAEDVGYCPECGNTLHYDKSEKTVECPFCAHMVEVEDIKSPSTVRMEIDKPIESSSVSFAMEIDNPDSALVYVENFFKKYDWSSYKQNPVIPVSEIDGVVNKHTVKYGANPASWILDFESKIVPLTAKLEGLRELEESFVSLYDGKDNAELMPRYRLYERITVSVKEAAESIFSALQSDIEYAQRFGASDTAINTMKLRFNCAVELYNQNVHDFNSYKDLPSVVKAIERRNEAAADKLNAGGIDAKATYEKAVRLYNSQNNKSAALHLFEAIRDYSDSIEYINKSNLYFNFDSKLLKLADKHFLLKQVTPPTFNVRKPEDSANSSDSTNETPKIPIREAKPTLSLYEVISGKACEPAAVSGITYILSFYGNKLFYIKRNRSLCSYDLYSHVETELDRGNVGDYQKEPPFWSKDGTTFYIRKNLSPFKAEQTGCIKSLLSVFKRKTPSFTDTKNNFALIKVDKVNNVASVEIDRLVDITEFYNDRLFYIAYNTVGDAVGPKLAPVPSYMVMDLKTGKKSKVLGDDCHIHNVVGDNVIFTTWEPNEYNQTLYSYNLKTDVTSLIEANILGYFDTVDDRVYYRVGNKKYAPLFSNNLDGSDRQEVMRAANEIYTVYDGWIYFIRGKRRNTTLFKMTPDGKETVPICTDVALIISINDVYVYYFDSKGVLHVADNGGKTNKIIADDIDQSNIIIDRDFIFFLRREPVGKDKTSYSLYKMNIDGSNIKKLLFNVNKIQNYDENSIYVYKCATTKYIATETENDLVQNEKMVKYKVSRFFIFDKNAETESLILSVGNPDEKSNVEKRGCFRKKIKHAVTYKEVPSNIPYRKEGIARAGQIYAQQTTLDITVD